MVSCWRLALELPTPRFAFGVLEPGSDLGMYICYLHFNLLRCMILFSAAIFLKIIYAYFETYRRSSI